MSVGSTRGRYNASQSSVTAARRARPHSDSSFGSEATEVFHDPFSPPDTKPGGPNSVFTLPPKMNLSRAQVLRYGTTRSLPDTRQNSSHHNGKIITNGHATAGGRLYSSKPRGKAAATRRMISSSSGHFKRSGMEKKESAISFFNIEMDKSPFYQYRPGENISGSVIMDVHRNVEIRFVELVIVGQGSISVLKSKQGLPSTVKESYLRKQTCVIGVVDTTWSSVLTPGHYVSKFRFRLPKSLPSSITHDDLSSGFKMDISYCITARICDDVGGSSSSVRSTSSGSHQLVKVLLARKQPFRVQRPFDLNLLPTATTPITHTEEIFLSCAGHNLVVVTLHLERAVFLAGDDIKLHLAASIPASQRIRFIHCRLQQHLKLHRHQDLATFTLSNVERTDPESASVTGDEASYDVTLPTQTNLVPSFLQGCSMVRLTYTLAVEMRFVPAGGKLSFTIPLGIGPCAEPIYAEKMSSRKAVPIFNRPTRFPCFSPTPFKPPTSPTTTPAAAAVRTDRSLSRSSQSINVVTKYSNSFWAKCFLCCMSAGHED